MQTINHPFHALMLRTLAAAVLLAGLGLSASAFADKESATDRVEERISELRSQISITPAQENQWEKVTHVMRENAQALDDLTKVRKAKGNTLTAVEDMQSYGEIVSAHAEGIHKLTPVFAELYASMSQAQQKQADEAFRHGHKRHHHGKHKSH